MIKLAKSLSGRTFHRAQTAFRLDASGQVIVMTLTNAAPLNDEQRALALRMLESSQLHPHWFRMSAAHESAGRSQG
ncbi:DUF1795 domain-containing protein [Burkholderia orbicola]|uniref:DUF1795 domain-containing protein n=1 Tax=Burkholderia orbicola TaxID=2978683 RepID=UPI001F382E08|nr:DUF1795 domain-containing protein [Burkholderia orbicola]